MRVTPSSAKLIQLAVCHEAPASSSRRLLAGRVHVPERRQRIPVQPRSRIQSVRARERTGRAAAGLLEVRIEVDGSFEVLLRRDAARVVAVPSRS